ncbi:4027_t:CDS:2, partial [Cetraspora pellucida]
MAEFDPSFIIPSEHKIRTMIAKSYQYNQNNLQHLLTDMFKDVMIDIIYFPSPYTAKAIADTLNRAINKWNLQNRITSITTDNGSNIVSAILILNTMQSYNEKKDGFKLKKIMLSDEEWDLIDNLIDLLMPFEEDNNEDLYLIESENDTVTSYIASLLDPRYKNWDFIENEKVKSELFQQLRNEYEALNYSESNFELQKD